MEINNSNFERRVAYFSGRWEFDNVVLEIKFEDIQIDYDLTQDQKSYLSAILGGEISPEEMSIETCLKQGVFGFFEPHNRPFRTFKNENKGC